MVKSKKSINARTRKHQQRVLNQNQISIVGEANYIISRAQDHDPRVVTLGSLVFFSTETGDAWMLDPGDNLALCLARDDEEQPFTITEDSTNFFIEWNAYYHIDADAFIVTERSGRNRTILGYPIADISKAASRLP